MGEIGRAAMVGERIWMCRNGIGWVGCRIEGDWGTPGYDIETWGEKYRDNDNYNEEYESLIEYCSLCPQAERTDGKRGLKYERE